PDGSEVDDFYVTTFSDAAMVFPVTKDGKILMVRQYKAGVDDIMVEFPAGLRENDEDPTLTAIRELREETGVVAEVENLEFMGRVALLSTKATIQVSRYFIRNVEITKNLILDKNEEIEVLSLEPKEVLEMIENGVIYAAESIALALQVKQRHPDIF
ncbi:NUDIX hydrolase, partial [Candidatus Dojkabacteria bacterium]|nr:NUDIX hydrolase [Candidatus Dojkabacteria bacterium]